MTLKLPRAILTSVEVNEAIGRISISGTVEGRPVSVVFMESEVPKSVKSEQQMQEYMVRRLKEAITPVEQGG